MWDDELFQKRSDPVPLGRLEAIAQACRSASAYFTHSAATASTAWDRSSVGRQVPCSTTSILSWRRGRQIPLINTCFWID